MPLVRAGGALMLVAGFAFSAAPAANAAGNKVYATPAGTGSACSQANPCSITTAVAIAAPNSHVLLADGTYDAQLTVTTSNLTIEGISKAHEAAVVIQPGPTTLGVNETKSDGTTGVEAVIGVSPGTTGVAIANLTIDGSQADLPACSGVSFSGIEFHDASGSVSHVHVAHTQPASGITGCQVGDAVYVASNDGLAGVTIANTTIDTYNKNGITCKGVGTTCTITSTTVTGSGPITAIAQNGIQLSAGSAGSIVNSNVSNNTDTACNCSSGILLYQAGEGITVSGGHVKSNDNNIYALGGDESTGNMFGLAITNVSSTKSTFFDGLSLDSVDSATVSGGNYSENLGYGIGVYGTTNSVISTTTTNRNVAAGIYLDGSGSFSASSEGNNVNTNTLKHNQGPGIWAASGAVANTFEFDVMRHNSPDAQDASDANNWNSNDCVTSNPATGLCS